jgi:septal ring factor EnvC (AmiA/AmiB activator)
MPDDESVNEKAQADRSSRRRLDNEIFMLQSDQSRFERQSNELEAQIRMMEKDIADRTFALEARKADRNRILQKAQDVEAEIIRVKRSSYKKK